MITLFSYVAIPTIDFDRALVFYSILSRQRLERQSDMPFPMAYFLNAEGRRVGHLFQLAAFRPSCDGPLVYIACGDALGEAVGEIERAGGRILMPPAALGPGRGYWAQILDSEGNRLALHGDTG